MNAKDGVTRNFLSDRNRFAQVCNNELFGGREIIDPEKLKELDSVSFYADRDQEDNIWKTKGMKLLKQRDVAKLYDDECLIMMIGVENQTGIHYAMPLRGQVYDVLNYERQRIAIADRHRKKKDLRGDEYISGFSKEDKLIPVFTLVVYYGTEAWDGPRELHEMLELPEELKPYQHLIGNYKINLLEIHSMENLNQYAGELKALFGFIKYQKNREKLWNFVQENEEVFKAVSMETAYAIKVMAGISGIERYLKQEEKKEAVDMCQAIQEMMEESRAEGYKEGCQVSLIQKVCKKLQKGKSLESIAEELEEDLSVILNIWETVKDTAPEFQWDQSL